MAHESHGVVAFPAFGWAFLPAMVLVTVIAFSLYVINTAMEGVFNPRLRK